MIAFCGIECTECPAYIATQNDDPEGRERVARRWSIDFQMNLTSEDMLCDGCLHIGKRLCSHCMICRIRKCGMEKQIGNCALCEEYPCAKLQDFFKTVPEARTRLDEIRQQVGFELASACD